MRLQSGGARPRPTTSLTVVAVVLLSFLCTHAVATSVPLYPTSSTSPSAPILQGSGISAFGIYAGTNNNIWYRAASLQESDLSLITSAPSRYVAIDFIAMPAAHNAQPIPDTAHCCSNVALTFKVLDDTGVLRDARSITMSPLK